jgi:Bacterial transcriptional activator domain
LTLVPVRIQLCGMLAVEIDGRRIDHDLPGRQGRLLLAFQALRTYEQLRTLLREELGIAPCAETLELHARLLSDRAPAAG